MKRVEAANPSLTVGALNLVPEFSATFDTNLMMQVLTQTSRNQKGECGRWRTRRVEAANPSLTVGAPNLVPEFSATFDTNLMMQVLNLDLDDLAHDEIAQDLKSQRQPSHPLPHVVVDEEFHVLGMHHVHHHGYGHGDGG